MAEEILQFSPFVSFVNPTFWHKLGELKIDVDRLDDGAKGISGFFSNTDSTGGGTSGKCLLEVDYTAFNNDFVAPYRYLKCKGMIYNKNTIEEFRGCDKNALMQTQGNTVADIIKSGDWIRDPSQLNSFLILSYADLKKFDFYYCFAFPAPLYDNAIHLEADPKALDVTRLEEATREIPGIDLSFCAFERDGNSGGFLYRSLEDVQAKSVADGESLGRLYFAFSDPSSNENPGWPLRVFIAALLQTWPSLGDKEINLICLRNSRRVNFSESKLIRLRMPQSIRIDEVQWLGWELNAKGKFAPKLAAMGASMDPVKLAETSTNLNLKLMKWRLLPDLNLDVVSRQKCLLFGAGTLGCGVARNLLAWGVRTMTLVDSGKVSYSNPVRQNLFRYEDALHNRPKAETAAERIMEICPSANVKGVSIHIPMPGHNVSESMMRECDDQFNAIEGLVKEHDVIFLLTDSRESRWLPTVLGAAHGKLVLNSALGFDSYLVMRHGMKTAKELPVERPDVPGYKSIFGHELGCYFCNDIVAPGNSLKDRTLDQQCTVTRPAVSNIAASLVVELLISLTQHPDQGAAPAFIKDHKISGGDIPEGLLGVIPHSIRGSINTFEQILPATERFSKCIACSETVLKAFEEEGFQLALQVFQSSRYLEDLTGITELLKDQDILECDEDEFDLSD